MIKSFSARKLVAMPNIFEVDKKSEDQDDHTENNKFLAIAKLHDKKL